MVGTGGTRTEGLEQAWTGRESHSLQSLTQKSPSDALRNTNHSPSCPAKRQLLLKKPVFSCLQVSQPLPAVEARDSSPEDGRGCARKPGPSLAPVDHEYPHYLEKVWGGEKDFFTRSRSSFFLYARALVEKRQQAKESGCKIN